jgi:P4 family phage/plasmid primase-like protien
MVINAASRLFSQNIKPLEIRMRGKAPIALQWHYGKSIETPEAAAELDSKIGSGRANLGVLCGILSGIIAVDVDSNDTDLLEAIPLILGDTPAIKKGNRGLTFFYLWSGELSCKIDLPADILGHIDILSNNIKKAGKNCVIPPSIHPDTELSYVWVGRDQELIKDNLKAVSKEQWQQLFDLLEVENTLTINTFVKESEDITTDNTEELPEIAQPAEAPVLATKYVTGIYNGNQEIKDLTRKLLSHVSPDCEYDKWVKVGFAINNVLSKDEGAELFKEWSSKSAKWAADEENNLGKLYDIFHREHPTTLRQVTFSTLKMYADENNLQLTDLEHAQYVELTRAVRSEAIQVPGIPTEETFFKYDYSKIDDPSSDESLIERVRQKFWDKAKYINDSVLYVFSDERNQWFPVDGSRHAFVCDFYYSCLRDLRREHAYLDRFRNNNGEFSATKERNHYHSMLGNFSSMHISRIIRAGPSFEHYGSDVFDGDPDTVAFSDNTKLNLRTLEVSPIVAKDMITKKLVLPYNPKADYSEWERILMDMFAYNDEPKAMVAFVKRLFGYLITGHTNEQTFFVLFGPQANGKSNLLETLDDILKTTHGNGWYTVTNENHFVRKPYSNKDVSDISRSFASFRDKRVVAVPDMTGGVEWMPGMMKMITEHAIESRKLYQETAKLANRCKFIFGANELPKYDKKDKGLLRRCMVIPCNRIFPQDPATKAKQRAELKERINTILPSILTWAIDGAHEYLTSGDLGIPKEMVEETADYKQEGTNVDECIHAACKQGESWVSLADCLHCVSAWYQFKYNKDPSTDLPDSPNGIKKLGKMLTNIGFEKKRIAEGMLYRIHLTYPENNHAAILKDLDIGLLS